MNLCETLQISVDELERSISVKISKEAVMSINSPEALFNSVNGKLVTKVYIAGLPNRTDHLIKSVSIHSTSDVILHFVLWFKQRVVGQVEDLTGL